MNKSIILWLNKHDMVVNNKRAWHRQASEFMLFEFVADMSDLLSHYVMIITRRLSEPRRAPRPIP